MLWFFANHFTTYHKDHGRFNRLLFRTRRTEAMKIGLLAYSTETGLGIQTRAFYENMPCSKVLIADISQFNHMPVDHSWCPDARITNGFPTNEDCEWLVNDMDVVFVCETPLNYYLYEYANSKKVATVQQYNYEFLDYFVKPHLPKPTVLASPTIWGLDIVQSLGITETKHWPVPFNRKHIAPRTITDVKTFTHIIGRPAAHDRNGTIPFLKAAIILGKAYNYEIFLQQPKEPRAIEYFEPVRLQIEEARQVLGDNLKVFTDTAKSEDMYRTGDVLVMPRRYGGLCLPMQEALCAGMPVIMPKVSPNMHELPEKWLCDAVLTGSFTPRAQVEICAPLIDDLVFTMRDLTYSIGVENVQSIDIAQNASWDNPFVKERVANDLQSAIDKARL